MKICFTNVNLHYYPSPSQAEERAKPQKSPPPPFTLGAAKLYCRCTMPELPEVEAARRALAEHCAGKKIVKAIVADDSKVIDGVSPKDFEAALVGKTIVAAHRKGKNMWIELDSPPFPSFQFGTVAIIVSSFFSR